MEIKSFIIKKLHGSLDYKLIFKDNTLVLIGENGSCKTTIIKILFYVLSSQWKKLSTYEFDSILIAFNDEKIAVNKKELNEINFFDDRILRHIPAQIRNEFFLMKERGFIDMERIQFLCRRYDIPFNYLLRKMDYDNSDDLFSDSKPNNTTSNELKVKIERIKKILENIHILYLPTYRRIEQELKVVLDGRIDESEFRERRIRNNPNISSHYTELIEFGMSDVIEARDRTLSSLKDFFRDSLNSLTLGYLGDVVEGKYRDVNANSLISVDEDTIHSIMSRVDESILSKHSKERLSSILQDIKERGVETEHDKVVCHYFIKLLGSHKQLEEKEIQIRKFQDVCKKYLQNKQICYDSSNFTFTIITNTGQVIEPYQLSSGEKQIMSLFSHLYLSEQREYFVLIDEPELSLSVKWQKQFLVDVKNGGFCKGLVAVTHSPFIFDNELDKYAHGLDEFTK